MIFDICVLLLFVSGLIWTIYRMFIKKIDNTWDALMNMWFCVPMFGMFLVATVAAVAKVLGMWV